MSGIWGNTFNNNPDEYDEADGSYFYGAAGTFATSSTSRSSAYGSQEHGALPLNYVASAPSSSSSSAFPATAALSGPRPGQQTNWPVPRARVSNYAAKAKPAPNYAAIAHRAMTEEDVEIARQEALQQEQLLREKDQQAKQKFLERSQPAPQSACHFFQLGTCKYGQSCRFAHTIMQEGLHEEEGGNAWNGGEYESARAAPRDGQSTSLQGGSALCSPLSATGPSFVYKGAMNYASASTMSVGTEETANYAEASECGICMGDQPTDKLYGILSHCNCVFCLGCIREWRSAGTERNPGMAGSTVRQCPLCRVASYFVVPSIRTFTLKSLVNADNGTAEEDTQTRQAALQAEKTAFIDAYKSSLKQKPCRNYLTEKTCPFGSSCFYLHIDANGELENGPDLDITSKPRYLLNAAGETVIVQQSAPREAFKLPSL